MATADLTWTVSGKSHADLTLTYDPATEDANGDVVVTGASGTYQTLDANGNVVDTDTVTGLIAPNSYLFAPDDKLKINGQNPIVDTAGVGVIINNAADADNIGPGNTPQVVFSTDIFGDYEELQKGGATGVGLNLGGGSSGGGGGATGGGGTTGGGGSGAGDTVSIDQNVAFVGHGTFVLTGHAASPSGVASVGFTADVDGTVENIGTATLASDGSYRLVDHLGRHSEGFITATETDNAGGSVSTAAPFALTAGLNGGASARQDEYSADGSTDEWTGNEHVDGSRSVTVNAADETLMSQFKDTFRNRQESGTTFVFTPGYGQDSIHGFVAAGSGHDVLSLPSSDFTDLAAVLGATSQGAHGAVIHDAASGDTLVLAGVSKTQLAANPSDIAFN